VNRQSKSPALSVTSIEDADVAEVIRLQQRTTFAKWLDGRDPTP
jgi:hypothetical protein